MNNRVFIFISFLSVACLACFVPSASAQPGGFASVTPERITELEAMHQQAIEFLLKNDFQGAIRAYSDILLVEPDDETAYTGLGQIYAILGHTKKAQEAFRNALTINPDNEVALSGIQKIMDPDGVEGMVSVRLTDLPKPFSPVLAPEAPMNKRFSAVKLKKGTPTSAPRPASLETARPVFSGRRAGIGRLGFLHAQRAQMALKNSGYYHGPVNGLLGESFKKSLREFQSVFGLDPTEKVDVKTWTRLSEYLTAF